jgi:hypothetical protein
MMRIRILLAMLLLLVAVLTLTTGCDEKASTSTLTTAPQESVVVPPFQLNGTRDVSFVNCVRIVANVVVQKTGPLTDRQLIEIAGQIVDDITKSKSVNAIGVFFWYSESTVGQQAAVASVDWAPSGQWDKADTVSTGSYSRHSYRVDFNNTEEIPPSKPVVTEKQVELSETQRKSIHYETWELVYKAGAQAEAAYPLPHPNDPGYTQAAFLEQSDKNYELKMRLEKQYLEELAARVGITYQDVKHLVSEGYEKSWPVPPFPD